MVDDRPGWPLGSYDFDEPASLVVTDDSNLPFVQGGYFARCTCCSQFFRQVRPETRKLENDIAASLIRDNPLFNKTRLINTHRCPRFPGSLRNTRQ